MNWKAGKASLLLFTLLFLDIFIVFNVQGVQLVNTVTEKNVIIVDIKGKGDYSSIQEAINDAQKGSKIYITKGEYCEILDIRKQIELIGEDKDLTLINPISKTNTRSNILAISGKIEYGAFGDRFRDFKTNGCSVCIHF